VKTANRLRFPVMAALAFVGMAFSLAQNEQRAWLAGDSHIHSHWSPGYDRTQNPPEPIVGGDGIYSTPTNAEKAKQYGLTWMVTTDHGGPNHSKLNLVHAYAELQESRKAVPEMLQFYGMEFNMPAMDHHTLIIPNTPDEWKVLFNIESQFDKNESWPPDPTRDSEAAATKALVYMNSLRRLPVLFANHPSRSATAVGQYGLDEPREFRSNNDVAPDVYRGMEGAPGHQAEGLAQDGTQKRDEAGQPTGNRGAYGNDKARTFGGFDQMTARLGGLWDSMLGEGRRFWIVATSDSHANFADPVKPGSDFWPGQYQKTYVMARRNYEDILDGLRDGRIFVVAGDLVRELQVTASIPGRTAGMGETLKTAKGSDVRVAIRFRVPAGKNAHGDNPGVNHVDLIVGDVRGPVENRNLDYNETTRVFARFTDKNTRCNGDACEMSAIVPKLDRNIYLRVRGTSTADLEPPMDTKGENPWTDLWFYSNPVFVETK
jgi:hypothetical protein